MIVAVVFAFLYEWRTALVCIVALPLSLLAAVLVLHWSGSTLNTMVLAGFVIALGVVVDDAILDVENIMRRLGERRAAGDTQSTARIILDASIEVRNPILYATLIVVIAVVPVFFMQALSGAFFKPLIFAYVTAILASLVVAVTITPVLCLFLLRNASLAGKGRRCPSGWGASTSGGSSGPPDTRCSVHDCAASSPWPARRLAFPGLFAAAAVQGAGLPDPLDHRSQHVAPGNAAHHQGWSAVSCARSQGCATSARISVRRSWRTRSSAWPTARTGSASIPRSTTTRRSPPSRKWWTAIPAYYRGVETYLDERIEEVLSGESEPIVVRIFGSDLTVLREQAERVRQAC